MKKTQVFENNCHPMFYEVHDLMIDYEIQSGLPPFILDVYDEDKKLMGSDEYDFIGRCVVPLNETNYRVVDPKSEDFNEKPPPPNKWHKLRYSPQSDECGEILVSFLIAKESDHAWE